LNYKERSNLFASLTGGELMIRRIPGRASIAIGVAAAVFSIYSMVVLAAPGQHQSKASGEISVVGDVNVDGSKVISGSTIFSDSTISTGQASNATISLGKLGRIELSPNSSLKLSFNETSVTGQLDSGRVSLSTAAGTSANIATKDGAVVADGSSPALFSVDVECGNTMVASQSGNVALQAGNETRQIAAGQDATAGQAAPGTRCTRLTQSGAGMGALSGGALAALLLAAGGAIAAAVIATTSDNNDVTLGGNVTVVSPTR
jgi:hypothetical protein